MFEACQYLFVGVIATITVGFGSWMSGVDMEDKHSTRSSNVSTSIPSETHQDVTFGQALMFPLYSSVSLLILFFFFEYVQYFLLAFLLFGSSVSVYQVLEVTHHEVLESRFSPRFNTYFPYANGIITCIIALEWLRSGNLWCHNILGCALCIVFISTLRFPSLKIAGLCLLLLFAYDMFWVFFSEYFFSDNVMVAVATKQASNPVHSIAMNLNLDSWIRSSASIELPIKLIFYNAFTKRVMMLGLGDIALPGALVSLALRSDITEERNSRLAQESKKDLESMLPNQSNLSISKQQVKPHLFVTAMIGYFASLLLAFFANIYSGHAQPALIYIVPGVLGPICWRAYCVGRFSDMWNGKFKLEWVN